MGTLYENELQSITLIMKEIYKGKNNYFYYLDNKISIVIFDTIRTYNTMFSKYIFHPNRTSGTLISTQNNLIKYNYNHDESDLLNIFRCLCQRYTESINLF